MKLTIFFLGFISINLFACDYQNVITNVSFNETNSSDNTLHKYKDIEDLHINWNDCLTKDNQKYFVYFYSLTCNSCKQLEDYVVSKAIASKIPIYFVLESKYDSYIENSYDVIGVSEIKNFGIVGYPSIIQVVDHKVYQSECGYDGVIFLLNYV